MAALRGLPSSGLWPVMTRLHDESKTRGNVRAFKLTVLPASNPPVLRLKPSLQKQSQDSPRLANLAHLEWITANLENAKLLMQHESDNKREADKLIARV